MRVSARLYVSTAASSSLQKSTSTASLATSGAVLSMSETECITVPLSFSRVLPEIARHLGDAGSGARHGTACLAREPRSLLQVGREHLEQERQHPCQGQPE